LGVIQRTGNDEWSIRPAFYLTDEAIKRADELRGEYALGTPVSLNPDNRASQGTFNTIMRARIRALMQILKGLSHYEIGTTEDYEKAANIFQEAANDPEWGAAPEKSGQEVLYLFLGKSAVLLQDADERIELLENSKRAYDKAVEYNPNYG
jgi:hypothetical protein